MNICWIPGPPCLLRPLAAVVLLSNFPPIPQSELTRYGRVVLQSADVDNRNVCLARRLVFAEQRGAAEVCLQTRHWFGGAS